MSSAARKKRYTRADFLAWEESQDERWEFVDGVITMMAGGTVAHNTISTNITVALDRALGKKDCRVFQHNQKVTPAETEDSTYPDVIVLCGPIDGKATYVESATLIAEVVSESSSRIDYGKKWESYRTIAELRHYLVVEQDKATVIAWSRPSADDPWKETRVEGVQGIVPLDALGATLALKDIYRRTAAAP